MPEINADLGEIAAELKPGRENRSEKIIRANLGLAMDDMATAIKIYKEALGNNIGTCLELRYPKLSLEWPIGVFYLPFIFLVTVFCRIRRKTDGTIFYRDSRALDAGNQASSP